MTNGLFLKDCN